MVSLVHEEDGGKVRFTGRLGFGVRFERRFSVHPDDPASSRLELRAVKEYGREGRVQARIEAWQLMTSTVTDYRLQASITVSDGGRPMLQPQLGRDHPARRHLKRRRPRSLSMIVWPPHLWSAGMTSTERARSQSHGSRPRRRSVGAPMRPLGALHPEL